MSDIEARFAIAADAIKALNQISQTHTGELIVLVSAVCALASVQPEPERFAAAFRRAWLLLGQPHAGGEASPAILAGIDRVLGTLEEMCPLPLKVRPPRQEPPPTR